MDDIQNQNQDQVSVIDPTATTNTTTAESPKQARKPRTISTSRLEKLREHLGLNVIDFFNAIVDFEKENPSDNFQQSLTNYGASVKLTKSGKSKSIKTDKTKPDHTTITYLFDNNILPLTGEVVKISKSRKYKGSDNAEQIYSVKLNMSTGNVATVDVDLRNLTSVVLYVKGVEINTSNISEMTDVPTRDRVISSSNNVDNIDSDNGVSDASQESFTNSVEIVNNVIDDEYNDSDDEDLTL